MQIHLFLKIECIRILEDVLFQSDQCRKCSCRLKGGDEKRGLSKQLIWIILMIYYLSFIRTRPT